MDQPTRRRPRRGPLPKGNRKLKSIGFEIDILSRITEVAEQDGLSPADIVNRLCAQGLGMKPPAYSMPKPRVEQEKLPLNQAS